MIFLMGPTAIGKTSLACELYNKFDLRLISVDSALIYKGMDIGTGKPTPEELASYPHSLIDLCEPWEPFSVGAFVEQAKLEIEQARSEKKVPLLVGGTMMYFKALQDGLAVLPQTKPEVRAYLQLELETLGLANLYERLEQVDPITASKLKPQDPQRILRALEIYTQTGEPMSSFLFRAEQKKAAEEELKAPVLALGLVPEDRSWLHQRIEARFLSMLTAGLIEEVEGIIRRNPYPEKPIFALRSVGYRQVQEYLAGEYDRKTMIEKAVAATRQLAKRQLTWLRSWPNLVELSVPDLDILNKSQELILKFVHD
jgi:tRNA dimethylallyltransferase